jgi:hypothetical protein
MARAALGKDIAQDASDQPELAFHYPLPYVLRTWQHLKEHGIYPNGKGYDDQDPELMADYDVCWWYYGDFVEALTADDGEAPHTTEREIEPTHNAPNWLDQMGKG